MKKILMILTAAILTLSFVISAADGAEENVPDPSDLTGFLTWITEETAALDPAGKDAELKGARLSGYYIGFVIFNSFTGKDTDTLRGILAAAAELPEVKAGFAGNFHGIIGPYAESFMQEDGRVTELVRSAGIPAQERPAEQVRQSWEILKAVITELFPVQD